jgi:hypothetical protein
MYPSLSTLLKSSSLLKDNIVFNAVYEKPINTVSIVTMFLPNNSLTCIIPLKKLVFNQIKKY